MRSSGERGSRDVPHENSGYEFRGSLESTRPMTALLIWSGFIAFILVMIALDLGVFHRRAHAVRLPEALSWTLVWIALALAFNVFVYFLYDKNWQGWDIDTFPLSGREAAIQYFTGYLVEKSLSVDNIFVIAMIFAYFRVPLKEQHRLLYWGVLGAVVLRGVMIGSGAALISRFTWVVYVFGVLLIMSAARLLVLRHDNLRPERNPLFRLARSFFPVTSEYAGSQFFIRSGGKLAATPLFLALVLVESSDVMFAVDSIPAIFAITRDPFLIFTSNVFAILGLRSLYFALAGLMDRFRYLKVSLVFVLAYVGIKMIMVHHYPIPVTFSLAVISGMLAVGIIASLVITEDTAKLVSPLVAELVTFSHTQARLVAAALSISTLVLVVLLIVLLPAATVVAIPVGAAVMALELFLARRWLARVRLEDRRRRSELSV